MRVFPYSVQKNVVPFIGALMDGIRLAPTCPIPARILNPHGHTHVKYACAVQCFKPLVASAKQRFGVPLADGVGVALHRRNTQDLPCARLAF